MALSNTGKLGLAVGLGGLAALGTNAIMVTKVSPLAEDGTESFWFKYRALIAALIAAGVGVVLWRVWDSEKGLIAGLAGALVAAGQPVNDYAAVNWRDPGATIDYPALAGQRRAANNVRQMAAAAAGR